MPEHELTRELLAALAKRQEVAAILCAGYLIDGLTDRAQHYARRALLANELWLLLLDL